MLFLYLMSANPTEKATETFSEKLTCESCGESFSCGSKLGKCWCFEIDLSEKNLKNLRKDYKSCLCENCLNTTKNYVHSSD